MIYYDILHQIMIFCASNYDFLHAGFYNMNIRCHNFFQRVKIFLSFKISNKKTADIKCILESDGYVDQWDKMVHSTSDFLHHQWCTKNFSSLQYIKELGLQPNLEGLASDLTLNSVSKPCPSSSSGWPKQLPKLGSKYLWALHGHPSSHGHPCARPKASFLQICLVISLLKLSTVSTSPVCRKICF